MSYKGPTEYIDVATRIVEFRNRHPEGSLQQVSYELVEAGGKTFLIYTAAAYRTPDDARPGIGTAWEPVPGPTPFTRDSEMQNAETAAWGRAIVAALAADTRQGVASADEVRARQAPVRSAEQVAQDRLLEVCQGLGLPPADAAARFKTEVGADIRNADAASIDAFTETLLAEGVPSE